MENCKDLNGSTLEYSRVKGNCLLAERRIFLVVKLIKTPRVCVKVCSICEHTSRDFRLIEYYLAGDGFSRLAVFV